MARIQIIDDDTFRISLHLTLRQMGHAVVEARDGAEGLRLFEGAQVDLEITDIEMPEKKGMEVLRTLRLKKSVEFIAMSGDSGRLRAVDNLHVAKLLGAEKVLQKPFLPEALTLAINELLLTGRTCASPAGFCRRGRLKYFPRLSLLP